MERERMRGWRLTEWFTKGEGFMGLGLRAKGIY